MSFPSEVKAELCRTALSHRCCTQTEACEVLFYCNQFTVSQVRTSTESNIFAARLPALFYRTFQFFFDRTPEERAVKRISSVAEPDKLSALQSAFGHEPADTLAHHINFAALEEEHYRLASFRRASLADGSVTDPAKCYHLELSTPRLSVNRELQVLLLECGFIPKETTCKVNSITYFKQSEAIKDFLIAIGASLAVMEVMNAKAEKDLQGSINRRVNCDMVNLDKAVDAAQGQIETIYRLEECGILEELPDKLKEAVDLRVIYPELALVQSAELCEPLVSKSAFNHRLCKLMEMARAQGGKEKKGQIAMEKQVARRRWKLTFWGLTTMVVALLALGLMLTLELALFPGLDVLAAVVFYTGLCTAVIKPRCPVCGGSVHHQATRAQEGIPFACLKCGWRLEMK